MGDVVNKSSLSSPTTHLNQKENGEKIQPLVIRGYTCGTMLGSLFFLVALFFSVPFGQIIVLIVQYSLSRIWIHLKIFWIGTAIMSLWGFTAEGDTNKLWQRFDVSDYNAVLVSFDWVFDFYDGLSGAKDVFILILSDFDSSPVNNITLNRLITQGNNNNH